jgi:hypothetical protein
MYAPLTAAQVHAAFDEATGIATIRYRGVLGAEASDQAYAWLDGLIAAVGVDRMVGEIFDFRDVSEFLPDNISSARVRSKRFNMRHNRGNVPIAMIVRDGMQEEILRGPMRNPVDNQRKKIVYTQDDALAFLHQWHASGASGDGRSSTL